MSRIHCRTSRLLAFPCRSRGHSSVHTSLHHCVRWLLEWTASDWLWALIATVAILVLTVAVMAGANALLTLAGLPPLQTTPSFLHFDPLVGRQRWILLAWLPFFFFNIMDEEIL